LRKKSSAKGVDRVRRRLHHGADWAVVSLAESVSIRYYSRITSRQSQVLIFVQSARLHSLAPQHHARPAGPSRPPTQSRPSYTQPIADRDVEAKSNGYAANESANGGGSGLNIKGAASGPYIVMAQNFVPGTTAADIESVMDTVGGQMASCKLVASNPTVIAEMAFVEKSGAEKVIDTFNNKKVGF
jgi:hypothetical protein